MGKIIEVIDISDDILYGKEYKELETGMYLAKINYVNLVKQDNSLSMALNFNIKFIQDSQSNRVGLTKDIRIYFKNRMGENISYGLHLIGSALKLANLPSQISDDLFKQRVIKTKKYDEEARGYIDVDSQEYCVKGLEGEELYVAVGLAYTAYNGKVFKRFNINGFFGKDMRSPAEIKNGETANEWRGIVESAKKRELTTKQEVEAFAAQPAYMPPYESTQATPSYTSQNYEVPQQTYIEDTPFDKPKNNGNITDDDSVPF